MESLRVLRNHESYWLIGFLASTWTGMNGRAFGSEGSSNGHMAKNQSDPNEREMLGMSTNMCRIHLYLLFFFSYLQRSQKWVPIISYTSKCYLNNNLK